MEQTAEPGLVAVVLGYVAYFLFKAYENISEGYTLMHLHMLVSAVAPIYAAAHASLLQPSSADPSMKPPRKRRSSSSGDGLEDDDDEDDDFDNGSQLVEGLTPSDAVMMPLLAGITLGGLYLLIKWLDDPSIISRLLGYYMSILGVLAVGKLNGDSISVITSFIFPSRWFDGKVKWTVEQDQAVAVANKVSDGPEVQQTVSTPFAGVLARLPLPAKLKVRVWSIRYYLTTRWTLRAYLRHVGKFKAKLGIHQVTGFLSSFVVAAAYILLDKPWFLTNYLGYGTTYSGIAMISPTTFWTATLILAGLFCYDVFMVFYTPMMVTVATSLDVPIKLVFPGPVRPSVLGLGDIVIPGIVMAMALRFDLYLFYLRKQGMVPVSSTDQQDGNSSITVKVPYIEATGGWGERFWMGRHLDLEGGSFPKVYFYAAITGYIVGIITTLVVMNIFKHAQPALLYLVPSVLGALWSTAFLRDEIDLMWNYTEAEETGDAAKTDPPEAKHPLSTSARRRPNNVFWLSLDAPLTRASCRKSVDNVSPSRRKLSVVTSDVPMSPEDCRRGWNESPPEKRRRVE